MHSWDIYAQRTNRSTSRSASRTAGDGTPRRERTRRGQPDFSADPSLSVAVSSKSSRTNADNSVLSPTTPAAQRPSALASGEHDPRPAVNHIQDQGNQDGHPQEIESSINQAGMKIEAANLSSSTSSPEGASRHMQIADDVDPTGPGNNLARSESRRNPPAPLPPKSAQRSRSVSNTSSRLSQTLHPDGGEINREASNSPSSQSGSPQEVSTPTLGPSATPRQHARYPSHGTIPSNGQQTVSASPRPPARSNSRTRTGGSISNLEQISQNSPQGSGIPTRSRSASRTHSRSNTLTRPEGEHGNLYNDTPTIAEDQEYSTLSQHEQEEVRQQAILASFEEAMQRSAKVTQAAAEHSRKQSVSSTLSLHDETQKRSSDPLPTDHTPSAKDYHGQQATYGETDQQGVAPTLRKQMSADPAALYHQHHSQSSAGSSPSLESRDGGRSKEPSEDSQHATERGRVRKQDDGSKPGVLAWVRSKSKSRDPVSRQKQDATVSVMDNSLIVKPIVPTVVREQTNHVLTPNDSHSLPIQNITLPCSLAAAAAYQDVQSRSPGSLPTKISKAIMKTGLHFQLLMVTLQRRTVDHLFSTASPFRSMVSSHHLSPILPPPKIHIKQGRSMPAPT